MKRDVDLTVEIVSAYVSNNSLPAAELPKLIAALYAAIAVRRAKGSSPPVPGRDPVEKPTAAEIRKSVQHDGIVSFVDGKIYKTLKRHLGCHGLSPRSYRERYGLPADYPMVAPGYAAQRSALAKAIGLGVPGGSASPQSPAHQALR
ncbi:MucR family transcriptional regulator [Methylobacterium sp. P31]